jgi:hypothetical protein
MINNLINTYSIASSGNNGQVDTTGTKWVYRRANVLGESGIVYENNMDTRSVDYIYVESHSSIPNRWFVLTTRYISTPAGNYLEPRIFTSTDNGSTYVPNTSLNFVFPNLPLVSGSTKYLYVKYMYDNVNSRIVMCAVEDNGPTYSTTISSDSGQTLYTSSTGDLYWGINPIYTHAYNYNTGLCAFVQNIGQNSWRIIASNGSQYSLPTTDIWVDNGFAYIELMYGNGLYALSVASTPTSGNNFTSYTRIYTSTNLSSWTLRYTSPGFQGYQRLIYTSLYNTVTGEFILSGNNTLVIGSYDGITWTQRSYTTNRPLTEHNAQEGLYNSTLDRHIFVSTSLSEKLYSVAAINNSFSYSSLLGPGGYIYTSGNESSGKIGYNSLNQSYSLNSVAYSPTLNRYVVVGEADYVAYSNDGFNTVTSSSFASQSESGRQLYGVAWGAGRFVIVGGGYNSVNYILATSSRNIIASSTTGTGSWTTSLNNNAIEIYTSIAFSTASTRFVVSVVDKTDNPTPRIKYSSTGTSWTDLTLPSAPGYTDRVFFTKLSYISDKNVFIALTNKPGLISYSTDGLNWTYHQIQDTTLFYSIVYGNNKLILGSNNAFYVIDTTSTLIGNTTKYVSFDNVGQIKGGSYSASDGWLLCGKNYLIKSTNTTSWTYYSSPTNYFSANGLYAIYSDSAFSTHDGTTMMTSSAESGINRIIKTNGLTYDIAQLPPESSTQIRFVDTSNYITYGNKHFIGLKTRSPN